MTFNIPSCEYKVSHTSNTQNMAKFKRSVSMEPKDVNDHVMSTNLRFKPYTTGSQRNRRLRSEDNQGRYCDSRRPITRLRLNKLKNVNKTLIGVTNTKDGVRERTNPRGDFNKCEMSKELLNSGKQISDLEMASLMKQSLNIVRLESTHTSPRSTDTSEKEYIMGDSVRNENSDRLSTPMIPFHKDLLEWHHETNCDDKLQCDNYHIPSFDDEAFTKKDEHYFSSDINTEKQPNGLLEKVYPDDAYNCNLKKADTLVLQSDDNDTLISQNGNGYQSEDDDEDFSLSLPLIVHPDIVSYECKPNLPFLINTKASRSTRNSDHGNMKNYLVSGESRQYFDLDEMISNDWLNQNYSRVNETIDTNISNQVIDPIPSELHHRYTCNVCDTNLEVDPFKTFDCPSWKEGCSDLNLFLNSHNHQSYGRDVTLWCPFCSQARVVFHS